MVRAIVPARAPRNSITVAYYYAALSSAGAARKWRKWARVKRSGIRADEMDVWFDSLFIATAFLRGKRAGLPRARREELFPSPLLSFFQLSNFCLPREKLTIFSKMSLNERKDGSVSISNKLGQPQMKNYPSHCHTQYGCFYLFTALIKNFVALQYKCRGRTKLRQSSSAGRGAPKFSGESFVPYDVGIPPPSPNPS